MHTDTKDTNESKIENTGDILGHPRGLAYIVFTEAWERFSFYGMQALLVLYMSGYLFHPEAAAQVVGFTAYKAAVESVFGELSIQALATQTFGLYIGFVYFMPVLGGLVGDRWTGRRNAVLLGAVAMAIGHFLMAFEASFLLAVSALIIGSGLLKGNLAAQVGALYKKTDQRRDSAFSIYSIAINVGATIAPLVCGTLGELYGWHYGFGAAGIGMLFGIAIYIVGSSHLPEETIDTIEGAEKGLKTGEGSQVFALVMIIAIASLYWVAQTQVWNTYPLWIKEQVDRNIFDMTVPITWFQSLDSFAVLALAPIILWYWRKQQRSNTETKELNKVIIGCAIFSTACIWLGIGNMLSQHGKVSLLWPTVFHFICAIGFLYAWPAILALVSRCAPTSVNAMMVGASYLAIFAGSIVSGWLGRFYEVLSPANFWLIHAIIVGSGALLLIVFRKAFTRTLKLGSG